MSLHPRRNISGLGDRDSECRVSKMFEGVHPTLHHNCQGGRGCLEIALLNKPLVSPHFTLIWPTVPLDSHKVLCTLTENKWKPHKNIEWVTGLRVCGFYDKVPPSVIHVNSCQWFFALLQFISQGKQPVHLSPPLPSGLPLSCCNICRAPCEIS